MYVDGIETVHNRPERNQDRGERHKGLIVFTETARPIGLITRDADMSQEYCDMAHWFLLNNSPEIEKYLEYVFHLNMCILSCVYVLGYVFHLNMCILSFVDVVSNA